MKRFLCLILSLISAVLVLNFASCKNKEAESLSFYCPDGAPSLSIAKFIADNSDFNREDVSVEYNIVKSSQISTAITAKNADFVILPINVATKLYNSTSEKYKMAGVITHGNFYFVSSFNLTDILELKGKVVYLPNLNGSIFDLNLKAVLSAKSIDYVEDSSSPIPDKVSLCYKSSAQLVIGALPSGGTDDFVALLPEPASSNIKNVKSAYSYTLDFQREFDSVNNGFPQAVLMIKESTLNKYPDIFEYIKNLFSENVEWAKNNPNQAIQIIKSNFEGSELPNNITSKIIEGCNIYFKDSNSQKQTVKDYISRIRTVSTTFINEVGEQFFL